MPGRVWKLGDNIDTDIIIPSQYLRLEPEEYANYMMEPLIPDFSKKVSEGDYIVGGDNFGSGSSREQAVYGLQVLGISAIFAKSFSRVFYRNSINRGLPALFIGAEAYEKINDGDTIDLKFEQGTINNITGKEEIKFEMVTPFLKRLLKAGGAINYYSRALID